jgi:serine/threonine protein phosphatase PrpC
MSASPKEIKINSASITDRGLNERRPLNEDSFLSDPERHIFAVADGVGGAEAGEVASRTAIDVLGEAFRHQVEGADIEDLMELAIQRANASIHQMAREHAKLSNMATTIVALHLADNIATIGHVGDSRLYRLTPDAKILRETEDHSIVEEEVRAGRMTPEQAANHPSKNVISRALGAEETVDVDLKTIEVEEGSCFLLCSDGITRHISDNELRQILLANEDLDSACAEFKRRCYERGAEDNLTAVIIRLGEPSTQAQSAALGERTLSLEYPPSTDGARPADGVFGGNLDRTQDVLVPAPSPVVVPAQSSLPSSPAVGTPDKPINIPATKSSGGGVGQSIARFFLFLLFVGAVAAAFYGGTRYHGPLPFGLSRSTETPPVAVPTPTPEDPVVTFEKARREVDRAPGEWLSATMQKEMARQNLINPLDSTEPKFLYLYGRALFLAGSYEEAAKAFEQAIVRSGQAPSPENGMVQRDSVLGLAAATLKTNKETQRALTHIDELKPKAEPQGNANR